MKKLLSVGQILCYNIIVRKGEIKITHSPCWERKKFLTVNQKKCYNINIEKRGWPPLKRRSRADDPPAGNSKGEENG